MLKKIFNFGATLIFLSAVSITTPVYANTDPQATPTVCVVGSSGAEQKRANLESEFAHAGIKITKVDDITNETAVKAFIEKLTELNAGNKIDGMDTAVSVSVIHVDGRGEIVGVYFWDVNTCYAGSIIIPSNVVIQLYRDAGILEDNG